MYVYLLYKYLQPDTKAGRLAKGANASYTTVNLIDNFFHGSERRPSRWTVHDCRG
jgi:hypothetical protein